ALLVPAPDAARARLEVALIDPARALALAVFVLLHADAAPGVEQRGQPCLGGRRARVRSDARRVQLGARARSVREDAEAIALAQLRAALEERDHREERARRVGAADPP